MSSPSAADRPVAGCPDLPGGRREELRLIEPTRHLGGMTVSGLGATDIGNKAAIGGMARQFYRRLGRAYGKSEEVWMFEPHVAEREFEDWLRSSRVEVVRGERLKLKSGVTKHGKRIDSIVMESGRSFRGSVFIDSSYEGDLLAGAGVSYVVGREPSSKYDESLNGVQTASAVKHQFVKQVDPYRTTGDPSSGLLPGIEPGPPPPDGTGDKRVQAYCYRMCTTDVSEKRRPWEKPAGYDPARYELLLRNFEAGDPRVPWHRVMLPNRKTDTNNNFAISTDFLGMNYAYAEADHATRERIAADHRNWQQGLMWTLANDPRVPEQVRREFQTWGRARDEFVDNDNWPYQLYIREARRMVGEVVMTQNHCQGRLAADDSIGLAAYTMDSHNVQRYVDATGHVRNEGDVQVGGFPPYPVSFRAIVPRRDECENLLVPVCLSASHIAYGSIRMEPVFMVLAESAACAASIATDAKCAVQDVPYPRLAERLAADGQILKWEKK
ncbi:MAG: FAD-dependent oxidoreductase [Planctomycetes bacterium]|nr:FAD-dependent oxidoreductase [Planctomycetota bacterium]